MKLLPLALSLLLTFSSGAVAQETPNQDTNHTPQNWSLDETLCIAATKLSVQDGVTGYMAIAVSETEYLISVSTTDMELPDFEPTPVTLLFNADRILEGTVSRKAANEFVVSIPLSDESSVLLAQSTWVEMQITGGGTFLVTSLAGTETVIPDLLNCKVKLKKAH